MANKVPIKEGLFKDGSDGPVLLASKCDSCGQAFFPKMEICNACDSDSMTQMALGKTGSLFTYSQVELPAAQFKPPYTVGYIDMPEGVRIFSQLEVVDQMPFEIGMEMTLKIETLWTQEDNEIVGYKFSPQKSAK
jgi:uncharacterized OB-fold protein